MPFSGQPWTESEHLGFLAGLKKLGKGNWRGISRLFVPSRTPTQVASHAQKHFLRVSGVTKRRSRFSTLDQAVSSGPVDTIHPLARPPFTAHVAAQAGAQSILEAAAHASSCSRAHPEFGVTCASVPSGLGSEYNQTPASGPSGEQLGSVVLSCVILSLLLRTCVCLCSAVVVPDSSHLLLQSIQPGERCLPTLEQHEGLSQQFPMRKSLSHSSSPRSADQQHTERLRAMEKSRSWCGCWLQLLQALAVLCIVDSCSNRHSQHSEQSSLNKLWKLEEPYAWLNGMNCIHRNLESAVSLDHGHSSVVVQQ